MFYETHEALLRGFWLDVIALFHDSLVLSFKIIGAKSSDLCDLTRAAFHVE